MKIDFHTHVLPATLTEEIRKKEAYRVKKIADYAAAKGLDAIVLTDFGHTEGFNILYNNFKENGKWLFDKGYELNKQESAVQISSSKYKKPLKVFLGEEIPTKQGEILGCFIKEYIRPGRGIDETIETINNQGGIVIFPHSLATLPGMGGIGEEELRTQLSKEDYTKAVEVFNGQLAFPASYFDKRAKAIAEELNAFQVGNSDARGYYKNEYERVGSVYTDFINLHGMSKESVIEYIKDKRETEIKGEYNSLGNVTKMIAPIAFKIVLKNIEKKMLERKFGKKLDLE